MCFSLTRRRRCRDELAKEGKRHEYRPQDLRERASPLRPVATATCAGVRNGNLLTTEGPFAETTKQLDGYFFVEAANLDETIAIADRIPPASAGTIEIRPVFELARLPPTRWAVAGDLCFQLQQARRC